MLVWQSNVSLILFSFVGSGYLLPRSPNNVFLSWDFCCSTILCLDKRFSWICLGFGEYFWCKIHFSSVWSVLIITSITCTCPPSNSWAHYLRGTFLSQSVCSRSLSQYEESAASPSFQMFISLYFVLHCEFYFIIQITNSVLVTILYLL